MEGTDTISGYAANPLFTNGAGHVKIDAINEALTAPDIFSEQIYAGIATGSQIMDGGIEHYSYWQFHVEGVDADDDITINISLDGTNFIAPGLVDVMTGAHIDQTAANIEADGIYVFGTVADQATRVALGVKAIKVTRVTATGGNSVTVTARAS